MKLLHVRLWFWCILLLGVTFLKLYAQVDETPTPDDVIAVQGGANLGSPVPFLMTDVMLRTNLTGWARDGVTGADIRVGVLDTGFGGLLEFEQTFDKAVTLVIPDADTIEYDANPVRHGRDVLEVIAQVAPNADLFACEYHNLDTYSLCVDYMLLENVQIINHSAGVPALPLDGTNAWARVVDKAAQAGVLWVNAAGNFANGYIVDFFSDTNVNGYHEFRGVGIQEMLLVEANAQQTGRIILSWESVTDIPANALDLDLEILDLATGDLIATSTLPQTGAFSEEPLELATVTMSRPFGIKIKDVNGTEEQIRMVLFVEFATLPTGGQGGSIIAPGDSQNALTVGALQGNVVAPYSSRGPIISGALKPDLVTFGEITLVDGSLFIGTSAAAPIVAGVAALVWETHPDWEREQIVRYIRDIATQDDAQIIGPDANYGMGILLLPLPEGETLPTPTPIASVATLLDGCVNALPTRLAAASAGIVRNRDDSKINIRAGVGTSNELIGQLLPLQTFTILAGPVCEDNFIWYQIDADSGSGWIREGMYDDNGLEFYFVEPLAEVNEQLQSDMSLQCNLDIQHDFEDDSTTPLWFMGSSQNSNISITSGAYRLEVLGSSRSNQPVSWGSLQNTVLAGDFYVVAEIRAENFANADDRVGLWLNYQSNSDFLAFTIRSDGAFQLSRYFYDYTPIVDWTVSPAIRIGDGENNFLAIVRRDNVYDVYLNNQLIVSTAIDEPMSGSIAFFGASWETPAIFRLESIRICGQG